MAEGSLEAPTRHALDWHNPDFYDEEKLDAELRRVFDICHGCRRCFNLCDSFPRLFDMIDESETMELDAVKSEDFAQVVEACTLCDMCFMTKCPYVPPHEFDLDFPHLMLRYRAVENRKGEVGLSSRAQLSKTDRNGKMAAPVSGARELGLEYQEQAHPAGDRIRRRDRPQRRAAEIRRQDLHGARQERRAGGEQGRARPMAARPCSMRPVS